MSKRSGPYLPDSKRRTVAIKLRLDPAVAARLRALAVARQCTLAEVVEQLVAGAREQP